MTDPRDIPYVPMFILGVDGELHGIDTPGNRELVRRIQACVQACEGISTGELERGIVQDMQRVISQVAPLLEARRDEALLAAVRNNGLPAYAETDRAA